MSNWGGRRPGAGKPKGTKQPQTLEKEMARAQLAEIVAAEIHPIAMALLKKAKAGDVMAARELFDRAWGKAPQAVDVTSKGEQLGNIDQAALVKAAEEYGASLATRKTS